MSPATIVAGVDVGGSRKGFHAVALRGGKFHGCFESKESTEVAGWCREIGALVIGVDSPCHWSNSGGARACERQLMGQKIWCFSTPTHAIAQNHPSGYYDWMLSGAALFGALRSTHELFNGSFCVPTDRLCFETFPHAVTWKMAGKPVFAKDKRVQRPELLRQAGVATENLKGIDRIDAAMCALTAHYFLLGAIELYGDACEGVIVVPGKSLSRS